MTLVSSDKDDIERKNLLAAARVISAEMGFDAMRICLGLHPINHSIDDVRRWMTYQIDRLCKPLHDRGES